MVGMRHATAFHTDRDKDGRPLSAPEREQLLKPYLPPTAIAMQPGIRLALRPLIHLVLFNIIHLIFRVYIRVRQVYHAVLGRALAVVYYHHRTPDFIQRDVKRLDKVPRHLSVILELPPEGGRRDRLETLVDDACEVAAWSASAGVPMLSIYERTGILKSALPHLHRRISRTLDLYFGATNPTRPTLSLRAPHLPSYSPPHSPTIAVPGDPSSDPPRQPHLTVLLIDAGDGRQTLVDLTKTLADMAQRGKLAAADVSSELIDAEISESVMGEPDLLITFAGRVLLAGYPPWHARLTEIFYAQDNGGAVSYHIFLRALYKYAKAEMRFGS